MVLHAGCHVWTFIDLSVLQGLLSGLRWRTPTVHVRIKPHVFLYTGGKLASHIFVSVTSHCSKLSGHCIIGWLHSKQFRKYGTSSMEIMEEADEEGFSSLWSCCYCPVITEICYSRAYNTSFPEHLFDDDVVYWKWFTILPLNPPFHTFFQFFSILGRPIICEPMLSPVNNFCWGTKSRTSQFCLGAPTCLHLKRMDFIRFPLKLLPGLVGIPCYPCSNP